MREGILSTRTAVLICGHRPLVLFVASTDRTLTRVPCSLLALFPQLSFVSKPRSGCGLALLSSCSNCCRTPQGMYEHQICWQVGSQHPGSPLRQSPPKQSTGRPLLFLQVLEVDTMKALLSLRRGLKAPCNVQHVAFRFHLSSWELFSAPAEDFLVLKKQASASRQVCLCSSARCKVLVCMISV